MITIKKNNYNNPFLITIVILLLVTGCSKKITPPDTSDIPDSLKYVLEDALVGRNEARGDLGTLYNEGKLIPQNINKALFWYELAGKDGDLLAQYNAGIIYKYKLSDKNYPDKYKKALYWFKKSAEFGDSDSQIKVAELYLYEFKNYKKALIWMKKAAKNNSSGMYNVGAMYNDKNLPYYNKKESFDWFKKAAENGDVNSMYYIGEDYYEGKIVPKNIIKAYKWMKKSLNEAGSSSDIELVKKQKIKLKELEKKLTPEQIAAVDKELGYKN